MSREELIGKIFQQKEKINNLQDEIGRVQRQFQKDVANSGVTLNTCQTKISFSVTMTRGGF
jgi:hypothetical protein